MFKIEKVSAHCDVPCGVYDPGEAQYAALSVKLICYWSEEIYLLCVAKSPKKTQGFIALQITRLETKR